MCFALTGMQIDPRKDGNTIKSTIRQKNGILNFYGNVVRSSGSKGVQIIDLILGYCIQYRCMEFDRSRVHHWNIFRK